MKIRHIKKFLQQNDKVKITMMFRGREIAYSDLGRKIMETIRDALDEVGAMEMQPKLEGRNMIMIVVPKK